MKKLVMGLTALAAAILLSTITETATAAPLMYRGQNIEAMGLYKSSALPSNPGTSLFGLTEVTGFEQFPDDIPANTILLFPIEVADWTNGTYDASGHKVPGVAGITSSASLIRVSYVYPNALQLPNPHIRILTDLIVPFVNVHINTVNNSGAGIGGSSIGDIMWSPLGALFTGLEQSPAQFSAFFGIYVGFPSGSYSDNHLFNMGNNEYFTTFYTNEVVNFTNLNNLFWDVQMHYTKVLRGNNDFELGASPTLTELVTGHPVSRYKHGDLFDFSMDLLYPVTKSLAIGPSYSVLDQVTNDTWNGSTVKNSGEFGMAAGFGGQYRLPLGDVQLKYLRSFSVRNMPAYNIFIAKLVIPFFL